MTLMTLCKRKRDRVPSLKCDPLSSTLLASDDVGTGQSCAEDFVPTDRISSDDNKDRIMVSVSSL